MIVIAGLGNPGKKFEKTRHNLGFLTVDLLGRRNGIEVNRIKHKALVGSGFICGEKVLLVKPQTYMNLSGESLREIVDYYDVAEDDIIVIYDDMDIGSGQLRIRKKGSSGSHNGMKSVIYQLRTDNFPRVRIGIGQSGPMDAADYVTGRFSDSEENILTDAVRKAAEAVECIVCEGIEAGMNNYNEKRRKTEKADGDCSEDD